MLKYNQNYINIIQLLKFKNNYNQKTIDIKMDKFQLVTQVQARSSQQASFYDKLKAYDQTIKQFQIPRSSKLAMEAYEAIIQKGVRQTHIISDQSRNIDIDDPQAFFSFAKDKKKTKRFYQHQVKPKKLFAIKAIQFKSDKIHAKTQKLKHNQIHSVSQFQVQQSTKTRHLSEPLNKMHSQLQQKKSQLLQYRFRKYGIMFLRKIQNIKYQLKTILNNKTAKYFHQIKLLNRSCRAIKVILDYKKRNQQIVDQIIKNKNEDLLEQIFIQWKKRAFMSEFERQYQKQIQKKANLLTQGLFIARLRYNNNIWIKKQRQSQQKTVQCQKLIALLQLKNQRQQRRKQEDNLGSLKSSLKKTQFLIFKKLCNATKIMQQAHQNSRIQKFMFIRGLKFFRKIREYHEFQEVYWRKKERIIPIYLILEAVKFNLLRKGFDSPWIKDFQQNIQHCKAYSFLSKYLLKRTFQALKQLLEKQKKQIEKIKLRRGRQFLLKITLNMKLSIQHETIEKKTQILQKKIELPKKIAILHQIMNKSNFQKRKESLQFYLKQKWASETIEVLRQYKLTKRFYTRKFMLYVEHSKGKMLEAYFKAFKAQVTRRKLIRNLLKTHLRIEENKKLINCFKAINNYCFDQKIIKLKSRNLLKMNRRTYFETFINKLAFFNNQAITVDSLQQKSHTVRNFIIGNRFSQWYRVFVQNKMYKSIQTQTKRQFEYQYKWKIFKTIKDFSQHLEITNRKVNAIKEISKKTIKKQVLNIMIEKLAMKLILKNIFRIRQKIVIKYCFNSIKQISEILRETYQQSFQ